MKIYVNPDGLIDAAHEIRQMLDYLDSNIYNIENLVNNLGTEWQGKSALAYTAKIYYIKKQYKNMYDFIYNYSIALESIANEYIENENNIKKHMED